MKPKAYIETSVISYYTARPKKTMWTDPIVEEIHKIRQEHAAKFNYDLRAIVRDYQRRQKLSGKKIVSFIRKNGHNVAPTERYEKQEFVEA